MFIIKTFSGDQAILKIYNKKRIPWLYKICPVLYNGRKIFLFDYVKIKDAEEGLEITFLKYITLQQRFEAFSMLHKTIQKMYGMNLIGLSINVCVNPLVKDTYGEIYTEKIIYPRPLDIWSFSPDKEVAKIEMDFEKCKKMFWVQNCEFIPPADYFSVNVQTERVNSLIFV
jgi:hypothetical protein